MPFSIEQFLEVFKAYNQHVFPFQILLYLMAFTAIFFALRKLNYSGKIISLILSFFWLWMGIIYHIVYFSEINKAALLFGALFIIQGMIFFIFGFLNNGLAFQFKPGIIGITGALLIFFSLIGYPLLSYFNEHFYPYNPTFGLPCPTTIFTFGMLCWIDKKPPLFVWAIPLLWSVIGFIAALSLGFYEDIGLFAAGIIFSVLIILKPK
jgi:Family of unknown function (DUF6064)